jgi:hypothetical protein
MMRREPKTPGQQAKELWEGINPDNMNESIRRAERLIHDLDPADPEWEEAYEYLESMARYREDLRGD